MSEPKESRLWEVNYVGTAYVYAHSAEDAKHAANDEVWDCLQVSADERRAHDFAYRASHPPQDMPLVGYDVNHDDYRSGEAPTIEEWLKRPAQAPRCPLPSSGHPRRPYGAAVTARPMTFGSLFSGIGGMDLGLERAGMECRWQVENEPYCTRVLEKHWPNVRRYGDIRAVEWGGVERVDLIAGGFPCQPVSLAGLCRAQDDERWLWPEFYAAVAALRPRYVLVENVPGLLVRGLGDVLGLLAAGGYDTEWQSVPAASVGAPHVRDRVWILAYSGSEHGGASGGSDEAGRRPHVFPEGADGQAPERQEHRQLLALVPGIDPGVASDWWRRQSRMDRTTHGVPAWMDRVGALGNAVVPQVAEWLGRRILEATA